MIDFKNIKGLLVDFDGVIADKSVFVSLAFFEKYLSRYSPLKMSTLKQFYKSTNSFSMKRRLGLLFSAFGIEDQLEECLAEILTIDWMSYEGVTVTIDPYFTLLIETCKSLEIPIKIFSATSIERLAKFGFSDLSLIYNTKEYAKADYRGFQKAAADLSVKPEELAHIDDGPLVLGAAKKAGLITIRKRNRFFTDEDFKAYEESVDMTIDSFEELTEKLV